MMQSLVTRTETRGTNAMVSEKVKEVERATLKTFQEEIPSIYFSDKTEAEFKAYSENAAYTYRDLLKFPPKMFAGASLIDFGAGTGENTVSLARWGATCTLVEMNDKALAVAKKVFERYAPTGSHQFVQSSIFDYESAAKHDIVHCRGVLSHTADKRGAFNKISGFVKPGGFLIFGDPNKAGGFQNMLQRFAVYRHASSWDEMVAVCEKLFKEDIDRSQSFVPRTRRSIIFDRWVIQSQDDPSVDEVLDWMAANDLVLYSSYPPFLLPLLGDSVHHRPKCDATNVKGMALLAETIWLLQKDGDQENLKALDANCVGYADCLAALTGYVANFNSRSSLDATRFNQLSDAAASAFGDVSILKPFQQRFAEFIAEAKTFVCLVQTATLDELRDYVTTCQHLFKGACGVRHVDFVAYKKS
jgi:2-polyprenyl-3-methyl-5-hydroxy-6-metoxy-1,4-benzoquinol methylase